MPFDFLKRRKDDEAEEASAPVSAPQSGRERGVGFDGLTEEWRITGEMLVEGRLSDGLNRRDAIPLANVRWAPVDGSAPMTDAPGIQSIDPYDLIIVLAGDGSLPPLTDAERSAHRIHKIPYDVALEVPPYRVVGRVFLFPGTEPSRLMDRGTDMFVPVVDAVASLDGKPLGDQAEAILVNRHYLRDVAQVDPRTGEPHQKMPGTTMGGVSWQDRSP